MESEHIVVYVTVPSQVVGQQIATTLLEKKLIACANIVPGLLSIYTWKGEICEDDEVLLIIKTRLALFEQVEDAVKATHPYEVPEIIALPIVAGSNDYLDWIDEVTGDE